MQELIDKAQGLYDKCKDAPEHSPQGMIAMIELRNMVPQLLDELRKAPECVDDKPAQLRRGIMTANQARATMGDGSIPVKTAESEQQLREQLNASVEAAINGITELACTDPRGHARRWR